MNSSAPPTAFGVRAALVQRAAPGARLRAQGAVVEALTAADLYDMNYGALRNALHWAWALHTRHLL